MENKLKPCPFCGSEAGLHKHERFGIECLECGAGFAAVFKSAEEAIVAWNTRAVKICEVEETFTEPITLDHIQEYRCHRCGEYSYMQILYSEDKINYCSHCGAKVIY